MDVPSIQAKEERLPFIRDEQRAESAASDSTQVCCYKEDLCDKQPDEDSERARAAA